MKIWFKGKKGLFIQGKMEDVLKKLPENSIDAVVTDPPYGLSFMGKKWDYDVPSVNQWREVFRVLKPGGHVLSFGGTRTYHRMVINIEDAGFEIRDQIQWIYGSGFPKSMDISKAIDKAAGAEREIIELGKRSGAPSGMTKQAGWNDGPMKNDNGFVEETAPATPESQQWEGWGTALKPASEPICLARKPLSKKNVAANVLKHGTGGINVNACRVAGEVTTNPLVRNAQGFSSNGLVQGVTGKGVVSTGRFPSNVIHDGSEEVLAYFPDSKGQQGDVRGTEPSRTGGEGTNCYGEYGRRTAFIKRQDSSSSAARFFYCAKASKKDRGEGNTHPTVKPQSLISYLVKLVLPSGGIVIDPFAGSGTLAKVCEDEEIRWCCIEKAEKHCDIAKERILGC